MASRMTVAEVVERLARPPHPPLIAIDGLPCSGKSTLTETLARRHGYECLPLDDFIRPETEWPSRVRPAFPFEYIVTTSSSMPSAAWRRRESAPTLHSTLRS